MIQVSLDLYLCHTYLPQPMWESRPSPRNAHHFISAYNCLIHPSQLTQVSRPLHGGWIISFACIWCITTFRIALTSHVVNSILHNSHMTLLTSIREPPQFVCLCRIDSRASAAIYPVHVLVCLRATCSIHAMWMTFGPLSTIPIWGTACATTIG